MKPRRALPVIICVTIALLMFMSLSLVPVASAVAPTATTPGPGNSDFGHSHKKNKHKHRPHDQSDAYDDSEAFDPQTPWVRVKIREGSVGNPVQIKVFKAGWGQAYRKMLQYGDDAPGPGKSQIWTSYTVAIPSDFTLVDEPFMMGLWTLGEGETVDDPGGTVEVKYSYEGMGLEPGEEENLSMYIYDPVNKVWVKVFTEVNIYTNELIGYVDYFMPLEPGENSLFAVFEDKPYSLESVTDAEGNTIFNDEESGFGMVVPPGTVPVGSFFDARELEPDEILPAPEGVTFDRVVYVQAWDDMHAPIRTVEQPITIEIEAPEGSKLMALKDGVWVDVETAVDDEGNSLYTVTYEDGKIIVQTTSLGGFAVVAPEAPAPEAPETEGTEPTT